jgi:hypothetical protein
MMRKETFVGEPDWMTIPFEKQPKLPFHQLLDTLLKTPLLMNRAEKIKRETRPDRKLKLCLDMADTCWELDEELSNFYSHLETVHEGPLFWTVVADDHDDYDDDFPFSYRLAFPDSRLGTTVMVYWGALSILWSGSCELYKLIEQLTSIKNNVTPLTSPDEPWPDFDEVAKRINLPPLKHRTEFITLARNICRSVDSCMGEFFTLPVIIAPLSIISDILHSWPGYEQEIQWALKALQRIGKMGVQIARSFPERVEID